MEEHPIQQPIRMIEIDTIPEVQGSFEVGRNGVTRIEACQKSGLRANIPYVRVWKDDVCAAEFCQHNIVGVYFDPPQQLAEPSDAEIARWKALGISNIKNGNCTTCGETQAECDCLPF